MFRGRPSSSRLRSVLRQVPAVAVGGRELVPAVPDFDRCSDLAQRGDARITPQDVPAVPDFDRCSDSDDRLSARGVALSQQFPTSIGAQTCEKSAPSPCSTCPSSSRLRSVLRHGTKDWLWMYGRSQQFPTSIGAQTYCPVYSRSIVSLSQQFPTSIGAQTGRRGSGPSRTVRSQQFPTSIGAQTRS